MHFYTSLFADSEIVDVEHYGPNEEGAEGTVRVATFALNGQQFMAIDTSVEHAWTFAPAISLHIACATAAEVDTYPFSHRYCWLADKYGVSWQIMVTQ